MPARTTAATAAGTTAATAAAHEAGVAVVAIGLLCVEGRDRLDLLQRLTSADVARLGPGGCQSTLFLNEKGRLIDWVTLVAEDTSTLLVGAPGRAATLAQWIDHYTILEEVRAQDVSADFAGMVLRGDAALVPLGLTALGPAGTCLAAHGGLWWRGLAAYGARVDGIVPAGIAPALLEAARRADVPVLSPEALELWRVRAGVPSPDHEYADAVSPLELRLDGVAVSFNKGCYIGQEVVSRTEAYDKLARLLVGLESSAALTLVGDELTILAHGAPAGRITSLVATPDGGATGLAVVKRNVAVGDELELVGPRGAAAARIVSRPFFERPAPQNEPPR